MTDTTLGRNVMFRQRHARIIGLGDRANPVATTPAIVATATDLQDSSMHLPEIIAPFVVGNDSDSLPANIELTGRGPLKMPFDDTSPKWSCEIGHVLPPSLAEADSASLGGQTQGLLAVSWQRLRHDPILNDDSLQPEIIVLVDAVQIAGHAGRLVRTLALLRTRFPQALIWCPAISGPDNLALLTWMGVDLHDLSRSRHAESRSVLLTATGPRHCEIELGESADLTRQISHWREEIAAVKQAVKSGSLRQLVEQRALNSPRLVEHLRHHDRLMRASLSNSMALQESLTEEDEMLLASLPSAPLSRHCDSNRIWRCHSPVNRDDALVADWIHRIETEYSPPTEQSEVLVLLPCSARKPYSSSQSHRRFRRVIRDRRMHEVMVTAPLGLVPRELEELWPAGHYDIPVTGDWDDNELKTIERLVKSLISRVGYSKIIDHSGLGFTSEQVGIECIDTRGNDTAGSSAALERLENAVQNALPVDDSPMREREFLLTRYRSISRWLYGCDNWLENARVVGRPPRWKIEVSGTQYAQWNPEQARFSFTKTSLQFLHQTNTLPKVHLKQGPAWKGDVFAPMVESVEGEIRKGDEVLVFRDGELLGSARSTTSGWEFFASPGRVAKAKHRV